MDPKVLQELKQRIATRNSRDINTITDEEVIRENFDLVAAKLCSGKTEVEIDYDDVRKFKIKTLDDSTVSLEECYMSSSAAALSQEQMKLKVIEVFEKQQTAKSIKIALPRLGQGNLGGTKQRPAPAATLEDDEEEEKAEKGTAAFDSDLAEKESQLAEAIQALQLALKTAKGDDHQERMKKVMLYQNPKEAASANHSKKPEEKDVVRFDMKREFQIIAEAVGILGDVKKDNFESFYRKFEQFFDFTEQENVSVTTKNMLGRDVQEEITISQITEKVEADRPAFFQNSLSATETEKLGLAPGTLVSQQGIAPDRFLLLINLKLKAAESILDPTEKRDAIGVLTVKKNELLSLQLPDQREAKREAIASIAQALDIDTIQVDEFVEEDQKIINGIKFALASADATARLLKIRRNLEELNGLKRDSLKAKTTGSFYELNYNQANHNSNNSKERAKLKESLKDQDQRIAARIALDNIELIFRDLVNPKVDRNTRLNLLGIVSLYEQNDKSIIASPLGYGYDLTFSFKQPAVKYKPVLVSASTLPLRSEADALHNSYCSLEDESIKANQAVISAIIGLNFFPGVNEFDQSDYGVTSKTLVRQSITEIKRVLTSTGHSYQATALEDALGAFDKPLTRDQFLNQFSVVLLQAFAPDGKCETCLKELRKNSELIDVLKIEEAVLDSDEISGLISSTLNNPSFNKAKADHEARFKAVTENFVKFKNRFDRAQLVEEISVIKEMSAIQVMEFYEQATSEVLTELQSYFPQRIAQFTKLVDVVPPEAEPVFVLPSSNPALQAAEPDPREKISTEEQLREIQQQLNESIEAVNNSEEFKYAEAVVDLFEKEKELSGAKFDVVKKVRDALRKVAVDVNKLKKAGVEEENKKEIYKTLNKMLAVLSDREEFVNVNGQEIHKLTAIPSLKALSEDMQNIERLKSEVQELRVIEANPDLGNAVKAAADAIEATKKSYALFQIYRKNIKKISDLIPSSNDDSTRKKLVEAQEEMARLVARADIGVNTISDFSDQVMTEIDNRFTSKISEQSGNLLEELAKMRKAISAKIAEQNKARILPIDNNAELVQQLRSELEALKEKAQYPVVVDNKTTVSTVLGFQSEEPKEKTAVSSEVAVLVDKTSTSKVSQKPSASIVIRGKREDSLPDTRSRRGNEIVKEDSFRKTAHDYYGGGKSTAGAVRKALGSQNSGAQQKELSALQSVKAEVKKFKDSGKAR